ncbi:MAG TPA: heparinase II/III family protein [Clostridiales bacterium]|nr:heparinase II/III family protein [Clostridiales bacterium]
MLIERYGNKISNILLPVDGIKPFPTIDDRARWKLVMPVLSKPVINEAEVYRNFKWPSLSASDFIESCKKNEDTPERLEVSAKRQVLRTLILAECLNGKNEYIDNIINGIWSICEESSWAIPANSYMHRNWPDPLPDATDPVIDLSSAATASLLTWAYYLMGSAFDKVSVNMNRRIKYEINKRILTPFLENDDIWWMGFQRMMNPRMKVLHPINNWNPTCNSCCLIAFLMLEDDWKRRIQGVLKAMEITDIYIGSYPADGGCDEGISYWSMAPAALFDILEQLYFATDGIIDIYNEPLIKDMGRYFYRAYIGKDNFINFADASSKLRLSNDLVYRYGRRISDDTLADIGAKMFMKEAEAFLREDEGGKLATRKPNILIRELPMLFNNKWMTVLLSKSDSSKSDMTATKCSAEFSCCKIPEGRKVDYYIRDVWLKDIQVMAAREQHGSYEGFYIAAKGGHNAESHNHNDVGNFIVYYNAEPVIVDPGVEIYSGKTFSQERYSLWTMQSSFHNLPSVNGYQQKEGRVYKATNVIYHNDNRKAVLAMNIDKAYPEESGICYWKRSCHLSRDSEKYIEIIEDFKLFELSDDIKLTYMTPCKLVYKSQENSGNETKGKICLKTKEKFENDLKKGIEMDSAKEEPENIYEKEFSKNMSEGRIPFLQFDTDVFDYSYETIQLNDMRLIDQWGSYLYRIILKPKQKVKEGNWSIKIVAM